ncbi:MAG: hypothetical protein A2Y17_04615 [Clostridiales bacterium GWF2_38_85]|nr:MAG: hypothetical protein A2Y17_04615 [Clostridiales bacterium GWF2_38_85]HBL84430.1 hypothetical protein [Clostridiales bacterium]
MKSKLLPIMLGTVLLLTACGTTGDTSSELSEQDSQIESTEESIPETENFGEMVYYTQDTLADCLLALNSYFGNGMVLQRDKEVSVWGTADESLNGRTVIVMFAGQTKTAIVEKEKWNVKLDPLAIDKTGSDLIITCTNISVSFSHVRVGDVWLASGQSNMCFFIEYLSGTSRTSIDNDCDYPDMGFLIIPEKKATVVQSDFERKAWVIPSKDTIAKNGISSTAFLFAREIYKNLDIPLGIVVSGAGSSTVEMWMNPAEITKAKLYSYTYQSESYYAAMINPLLPMAFKGMIWYQGEGNSYNPDPYGDYLKVFVESTRRLFNNLDMPFIQVGLPSYDDLDYTKVRLLQLQTQSLVPNMYTTINYDSGNPKDLHPIDKLVIGTRLANMALEKIYNIDKPVDYPTLASYEVNGNEATLVFNTTSGLKMTDGEINSLEICGADGVFVKAICTIIDEKTIKITSSVEQIKKIKLGCNPTVIPCELTSNEELPVASFMIEIN